MTDAYVVVDIATTCDETGYVGKDSMEIIEISWVVISASTLKTVNTDSILIRPVNTPITPYCTQKYDINWELVRSAGTFKEGVEKFTDLLSNYESFSFVTYDINKLRVQLIREARDKSVDLPEYLKYPRVFDLEKEVGKWKKENIQGLSTMLNVLSVEDLHKNEQDQQDQQDNSDTKARKYVNLYSKILIQLIKKSIPVQDYPDVLTKPYDSKQDINAFKLEKSKILYLANLPQDTTQSELESWFTQYGGRPIAFWCVKGDTTAGDTSSANNGFSSGNNSGNNSIISINGNSNSGDSPNLDSSEFNQKNVSGFAVFATHEEAIESLSMNGRVLNDKSVEVQPSSIKILDNASDLLTPFPPSKNRPRPGDWTCPSCGFSNFQRRTHCFRCSFPASSAVAIQESMYSGRRAGNNNSNTNTNNSNSSNTNKPTGNTISTNISNNNSTDKLPYNINSVSSNTQYYDQSPNYSQPNTPSHYQSNQNNGQMTNGSNQQHNNGNNNNNNNNNSNNSNNTRGTHYGNNVPFRAGDWKCEICMYHNFAKNLCCLKCSASKPLVNMPNQQNAIHSVNSTAAAIAAATASGQPLNLNNGYHMGIQQPQPHHVYNQQGQRKSSNNSVKYQYQYQNQNQNQNHQQQQQQQQQQTQQTNQQPSQYSKNINYNANLNSNSQQQLQQHYSMLVSQQPNQIKFSQSAQNSPGLYPHFSNQGQYSKQSTPNSTGIANDSTASIDSNIQMNPSFNMLTGQIGSLNLNQQ